MSNSSYSEMNFDEALQRYIQTDPSEIGIAGIANMKEEKVDDLMSAFEAKAHIDQDGVEFWYARDLQKLFGYTRWEEFQKAIEKAKAACQNFGKDPLNYFQEVFRGAPKNSQGGRTSRDFKLSRYAAYLVAMNSDPRKKEIAFAQTYFAIQTRKQELHEQSVHQGLSKEEQDRLNTRQQLKDHHKFLAATAKKSGVITPKNFAIFNHNGYIGLYKNSLKAVKKKKNLSEKDNLHDYSGYTELAANLFRATQTEEKLRKDNVTKKEVAYKTHYEVGQKVRALMLELSGIAPEDLPTAPDIKQIEKRITKTKAATPIPKEPTKKTINISRDLWKYSLLLMASKPAGIIMTPELIKELPEFIETPVTATNTSASRQETKFPQLVRNLKSNKKNKTNFITQGYVHDIKGGFQITPKGLEFVKVYFEDRIKF